MRINQTGTVLSPNSEHIRKKSDTKFKGSGGLLALSGTIMQGIENKGYLASFLIQDGLGMTVPRVATGFNRDKEITGKYNMQEGFEVLGREGLTGPYIIAVAPAVLWLTRKFCKSTNTNTNLLKRFGENLKTFVKDSQIDKTVKESAEKFKEEFSRFNIEKLYKNSVKNDKNPGEAVDYLVSEFKKLDSKDKKVREEGMNNIVQRINDEILQSSDDLFLLNKVSLGEGETAKLFGTKDAISALHDFCNDAIIKNKDFAAIDEATAENIKNNFATKRMLTNISNVVLTLGGLAVLPKLYAKSDVSPSAQTLQHIKNMQQTDGNEKDVNETETKSKEIAFKGRGVNSDGILAKIGKFLTKHVPEKMTDLFEYAGYNFSKTTFACLSIFGLLVPRGMRAWERAKVDENGNRDKTELHEIFVRDTISSLSVVFAVPILTKLFVSGYEKNLGFVLTNKASENKNAFRKFLDVINPYSDLQALSLAELDAIYGNIDSKSKLMNFAKFIDKNGGDLEKILSKSDDVSALFNDKTFTLDSIKNLNLAEKNKRIISLFNDIEAKDANAKNELITKLMKSANDVKSSSIAKVARGLNSFPSMFSTFVISPILLGYLIPKLTYINTKKTQMKVAQGEQEK